MSVDAVAGHELGPVCTAVCVEPVAVHAASGAEPVSVDAARWAEPVPIDAVGRVEPVSVDPVGRAQSAALDAVGRAQSVGGLSVYALKGAQADHRPGTASTPQ